jgi:hypothetical protein
MALLMWLLPGRERERATLGWDAVPFPREVKERAHGRIDPS